MSPIKRQTRLQLQASTSTPPCDAATNRSVTSNSAKSINKALPNTLASPASPVRQFDISAKFTELKVALSKKIDDANLSTSALINELKQRMEDSYLALTNSIDAKVNSMRSDIKLVTDNFSAFSVEVDEKIHRHGTEIASKLD